MAKITYVATFSDGATISRKTDRTYTHAWRVLGYADQVVSEGFSGRRDLAQSAAQTIVQNGRFVNENRRAEVVPTAIAPEGFEKQCKTDKPFTVRRHYSDGRSYVEKNGPRAMRYATREAAQVRADALNAREASYTRQPWQTVTTEYKVDGPAELNAFGEPATQGTDPNA